MPKRYRLSHADFVRLGKVRGRRIHGTYFSLSIAPLSGGEAKMASIVSKKVSNRAVDRNRIERQCREAMRVYMSKVTESIALVFTAKAEAREASRSDLRDDIAELMSRAALA